MSRFTIIACGNYAREVKTVLDRLSLKDLDYVVMPTHCSRCLRNNPTEMKSFLESRNLTKGNYYLIGDLVDEIDSTVKTHICHVALTNESLVLHWLKMGNYLITPGWLQNWKNVVFKEWGFSEDTGTVFLKEAIQKIVLLDSGIYEDVKGDLVEFSTQCHATYEIMPVGLSYLANDIARFYYEWKQKTLDLQIKLDRQKIADYEVAFDLITEQSGIQDSPAVIKRIEEIGNLMTAARVVRYIPFNEINLDLNFEAYDFDQLSQTLEGSIGKYLDGLVSNDQTSFFIGIMFGEEKLGLLLFDKLLFAERMLAYRRLFRNLAPVFAVNLMNATHYGALLKEKTISEKANAAKEVFLSIMSHEVRGPLNGVSGALQLIRMGGVTESQNELLSIAEDALGSLLSSINTILDYTKVKSGVQILSPQKFMIQNLLNDVLSLFKGISRLKNIELVETIDPAISGYMVGDVDKLKQILVNLVGNSMKFTDSGVIEVAVNGTPSLIDQSITLEFSVNDTGIGIPPTKLETIFEAFEQGDVRTSSQYGGTGLGLAIVKELVGILGGNIIAQNRVTGGCSFVFKCVLLMDTNQN